MSSSAIVIQTKAIAVSCVLRIYRTTRNSFRVARLDAWLRKAYLTGWPSIPFRRRRKWQQASAMWSNSSILNHEHRVDGHFGVLQCSGCARIQSRSRCGLCRTGNLHFKQRHAAFADGGTNRNGESHCPRERWSTAATNCGKILQASRSCHRRNRTLDRHEILGT